MCSSHRSGIFALGVIHLTSGLLISVAQGTLTVYLEVQGALIGRDMNISPGLWLGISLLITGLIATIFSRKQRDSQVLPIILMAFLAVSLGLTLVVIALDGKFLMEYKKWLWRKQRYAHDPNPPIDAEFNLYHQLLRNRIDIEALFVLAACLMGLTVLEIVLLVISIAVLGKFLCMCCSEAAFVKNTKYKARTTVRMVPSRENLRHSMPLLTTEL